MKRSILLVVGMVLAGLINAAAFAACPSADLTGDCRVDLEDFTVISAGWLGEYDLDDVNSLADQWLDDGDEQFLAKEYRRILPLIKWLKKNGRFNHDDLVI